MSQGFLYRVAPTKAERVLALAAELVQTPCWAFSGAALWDFQPQQGPANLRPISRLTSEGDLASLSLEGDFGHIFSRQAELRWKRLDTELYDVLVLSEAPLTIAGADELLVEWEDDAGRPMRRPWTTSAPGSKGLIQTDGRPRIAYLNYHAPNGAVQFLRYTEVLP